jgi:alpha-tubulin suppressor-like RCC1 family protein
MGAGADAPPLRSNAAASARTAARRVVWLLLALTSCGSRTQLLSYDRASGNARRDESPDATPAVELPCPLGYADCNGLGEDSCETEIASSVEHCGACQHHCDAGLACGDGICRPPTDVVQVCESGKSSCARRASGEVLCWGLNEHGELGDGTLTAYREFAAPVVELPAAVEIACAPGATCARTRDDRIFCWGLGSPEVFYPAAHDSTPHPVPVEVWNVPEPAGLATSGGYVCVLRRRGTVECWGDNHDGNLGRLPGSTVRDNEPTPVDGLSDAVQLSASSATCALRRSGLVSCWGDNAFGAVGPDASFSIVRTPVPLPVKGVVHVGTGNFTCVVQTNGAVSCWGASTPLQEPPTLVGAVEVGVGNQHACVRASSGGVLCWGTDTEWVDPENGCCVGLLGAGVEPDQPAQPEGLDDAEDVAVSYRHTCAVRRSGGVVCWGWNRYGQLGDSTTENRTTPVSVVGL